ncbi:bcl-2/adenovirus E1B 19 kDa-interacting protein 2-like protein isoform X2 [Microcaecilia unicolor]|nr:bcl-2/adenovirus E1B 19 kDa-interacting protein 2-like protein isoform X2 [Microcaecilia unicolor]
MAFSLVLLETGKKGRDLYNRALNPVSEIRYKKSLWAQDSPEPVVRHLCIDDMELKEEWQEEEYPRLFPEEALEEDLEDASGDGRPVPANTLQLCGNRHMKKRLLAPTLSLTLEHREGSVASGEGHDHSLDEDFDIDVDELDTPSDSEHVEIHENSHEFDWEDDLPRAKGLDDGATEDTFGEGRVADMEDQTGRKWRIFLMGDEEHKVDMTIIEPYKRVISHGGYYGDGLNVVVLFASCYLPESNTPNYQYIMDNLFRYIIGTLELMVAESYMLVYLNGATPRNKIPSISWIKQCYQTIDRRLKKNLKALIIVHPTWYMRALMAIVRPFISSKFGRKVQFMSSLWELSQLVSLDQLHIPECIRQ